MMHQTIGPNRFLFRSLLRFGADKILAARDGAEDFKQLQLVLARRMFKRLLLTMTYVIFSIPLIVVGPIFDFIYKNKYSIPTGVILPFVDPDTFRGFATNFFVQSFASFIGTAALLMIECCFSLFDSNLYMMKEITKYHLRRLNENILNPNLNHKRELKDIVKMLEDIHEYVEVFNKIIYFKSFIQPTFTTASVGIAVLLQFTVRVESAAECYVLSLFYHHFHFSFRRAIGQRDTD